jgi:hypothetical protein
MKISSVSIERILKEMEDLPEFDKQLPLQGVEDQTDMSYGSGQVDLLKNKETDFTHPLYPELKYINSIMSDMKMYRTRILKLHSFDCYSYHYDLSKRIHIPITTNKKCMFIIDDIVYRFPADGSVYLVDTTKFHTAINANREDFIRIHIVGCVNES